MPKKNKDQTDDEMIEIKIRRKDLELFATFPMFARGMIRESLALIDDNKKGMGFALLGEFGSAHCGTMIDILHRTPDLDRITRYVHKKMAHQAKIQMEKDIKEAKELADIFQVMSGTKERASDVGYR